MCDYWEYKQWRQSRCLQWSPCHLPSMKVAAIKVSQTLNWQLSEGGKYYEEGLSSPNIGLWNNLFICQTEQGRVVSALFASFWDHNEKSNDCFLTKMGRLQIKILSSTLILRNIFYLLSFHLRIYPGLAMFEGEGAGWGVQVVAWSRCSGARSLLISCSLSPWLLGNPFPPPPSIAPSTTVHHQAWNWKYFCKNMEYFLHFKRCVVVQIWTSKVLLWLKSYNSDPDRWVLNNRKIWMI